MVKFLNSYSWVSENATAQDIIFMANFHEFYNKMGVKVDVYNSILLNGRSIICPN
jgi:hypothetical protein